MVALITGSAFFVILLIDVPLKNVNGENVVKPGSINKNVVPISPGVEHFAKLQEKLENIRDMANHYQSTESITEGMSEMLHRIPEVQTIIEGCMKFHAPIACSDTLYRSMDGSCNNLKHSEWGKAISEARRLLPANYEGTHGLRKSVNGGSLPNARRISLSMTNHSNPSASTSALFTFFGQFITHDMSMTPSMTENGVAIKCCDPSKSSNPFCASTEIPPDDPFFAQYNRTCQAVTRAAPYPRCNFAEKRGVINAKSSFLDASNVYGNNAEHSKMLRTNDGTGRLRTQNTRYGDLLPKNHNKEKLFCPVASIEKCFEGGDDRLNQHTMLLTLQTIFPRLHNNIADALHRLNPYWNDDKVYQESRRIVIALLQYVVYEEYLPLLLGSENLKRYALDSKKITRYNDTIDPSLIVEFSTAAFRAHSMVPTHVSSSMPRLKLRNTYSNLRLIHRGFLDTLLAGASEVPSENDDEFQTDDISKYLLKAPGETFGVDLTVVDILRGRDLGLPSYTEMVFVCFNGLQIQDFSQLRDSGLMSEKNTQELMNIYKDVRDIDLIVGILREMRGNAVLGPTATCIASNQFHRLKFGDSFFFTHFNGKNPFSREQLDSLRTYSLARIICETTVVEQVRMRPLMNPSPNNRLVPCASFSPMNFKAWKE